MAIFTFAAPDGKEYDIEAPEGATQDEALDYLVSNWDTLSKSSQETAKVNEPIAKDTTPVQEQQPQSIDNLKGEDVLKAIGGTPSQETGDFARGFQTAYKQLPQLGYGLEAGAAAAGESVFGEGGMLTNAKKEAVAKYEQAGKELEATAKPTDSATYSFEKAQQGDYGSLVDTLQYGLGYGAGQLTQGGLASIGGKLVGKAVARATAENIAEKMVAEEMAKWEAKVTAGTLTEEQLKSLGTQEVAKKMAEVGSKVALGSQAFGMEAGEIGGDLAKQSVNENRTLTTGEVVKGLGSAIAATALEYGAYRFTLGALTGKGSLTDVGKYTEGLKGNLLRGAGLGVSGVGVEGGTEFAQTLIEEAGKGKDPFSSESLRQAIDAAALGGIGGGGISAIGGALSPAQQKPDQPATGEIDSSMLSGGLPNTNTQTTAQQPAQTSSDWQKTMGDIRSIVGENQLVDNETIGKDIGEAPTVDDALKVFNHVGEAISTDHAITHEVATQEQLNIASQRGNDQITGVTEPLLQEPVKPKSDKLDATQESLDFIGQAVAQGGAELKGSMLYLPTGEKYSLNKAQRDHYNNLVTPVTEMPIAQSFITMGKGTVETRQGQDQISGVEEPKTPVTVDLYRGVPKGALTEDTNATVGNSLFMTPTEQIAKDYAGKEGAVSKSTHTFNNLLEAQTWADAKSKIGLTSADTMETLVNVAREQGYDGITFTTKFNGKEYIVLKPDKTKAVATPTAETPTADYETRNADRVARIKEATTPEEAQSIYAEETSDNERHFEGTRKAEIAIKDTLDKLKRESANKKEDEAYAAGKWVFHFPTNSLSDANQMAKSMEKIEPKNEYRVVPWQNDGYLVQKRNIEAALKLPKEKTGTIENPILKKNGSAFPSQQSAQTYIRTNPELSKETHTWVKLGDEKYGIVTKDQVVSKLTNPAANLNKVQGNEELRVLIQKLGGLSRVEMKERGFTDYKANTRLFNNGVRSRTFDDMATVLRADHGFDEIQGANDLETALWGSLNGKPYYGYEGIDNAMDKMAADKADQEQQNQDELLNTYTNDELNKILDAKTQAEKDQIIKDIKAEKKRKADQEVDTVVDEMLGKGKTTTMDIFAPERKGKVAVGREVTVEGEQLANSGTKVKELYPNHWFYGNKGAQDKFNGTEIDYEGEYPNLESISLINTDSNIGGFYDQVEQAIYQTTQSDRTTLHELGHAIHHQLLNYRKLTENERAILKEMILGDEQANHPYLASDKELVAEFNLYAHLFPVKAKVYLPELYKELVAGRKEVVIKLGSQESQGLTQALKQANVTIEKGYGEEEDSIPKNTEKDLDNYDRYKVARYEESKKEIIDFLNELGVWTHLLLKESKDFLVAPIISLNKNIRHVLILKASPSVKYGNIIFLDENGQIAKEPNSYSRIAKNLFGREKGREITSNEILNPKVLSEYKNQLRDAKPSGYSIVDKVDKLKSLSRLTTVEDRNSQLQEILGDVWDKAVSESKKPSKSNIKFSKAKTQERLAPNGKPSNLNATQYEQVRTPEFKEWFGDWENDPENASKVVDENGEPLVAYHGTNADFNEFQREFIGQQGTAEGKGFYFTTNQSIAESYGNVKSVFLNIRNPMDYEKLTITKSQLKNVIKTLDPKGIEYLTNYGDVAYDGYNSVLNEAVNSEYESSDNDVDLFHSILNATGDNYDAVIPAFEKVTSMDGTIVQNPDWGEHTIFVALNPNQIKSATDNTGEFSKKSNDIRFSQVQEPTADNHTEQSLKEGLTQAGDNAYGKGWTDRLLATGMFEIISDADAQAIIEEAAEVSYSKNGEIEAFFNPADGKTYFVAENIDKATDLHYLMMHEVGVHALNMGGNKEEFESILKQVDNLIKVKNPAALKGRQDALDADTPQEDLREETLAYLVKYVPKLKVVQQFKAWLKNALRNMGKMFPASQRLGFIQWANKLSDQDLLYIANATLRKAPEMLSKSIQPQYESDAILAAKAENRSLIVGNLERLKGENPDAHQAVMDYLDRIPEDELKRVSDNLEEFKGTPWAMVAVKSMVIRQIYHLSENYESNKDTIDKLTSGTLWGKDDISRYATLKVFLGKDREKKIQLLGKAYDFVGDNRKAENDVAGSFINCDPSKACAEHCYAALVNGRPAELLKAEYTEYMASKYPEILANRIYDQYSVTAAFKEKLTLRLNDKGELSPAQLKVIELLNEKGVVLQVFSKRPELLKQVNDRNLKMLSIDTTNFDLALNNPEFKLAITLTDDFTPEMIAKIDDRVSVYLPVNLKGKEWSREKLREMYPEKYKDMSKRICPVDSENVTTKTGTSFVQVLNKEAKGLWTCTTCDKLGTVGCFKGFNTEKTAKYVSASSIGNLSKEKALAKKQDDISSMLSEFKQMEGIDNDTYRKIIELLSKRPSELSESNEQVGDRATENKNIKQNGGNIQEGTGTGETTGTTSNSLKFSKKAKEGEIVNRSTGYTAYDQAKPIQEEVDNKANYPEGVSLEERDWLMQQLRRFDSFRKLNDKSNELINKYLTTMGRLPELGNYLGLRYQTLGKIDNVDDIVRNVFDTLQKATKEDSKEIYTYLTDNKATTEFIIDPQMALMAKDLKEAITIIGKKLVEFNIIPMESFQMYEGRYLPRVYLEHIIQSSDRYQSLGSGKTLSPMGYAKRRDNNLPEEFRRLIKGEIKNTAYLASRTLSIPLRDIAMMEFFNQISDNEKWVWKQSLITVEIDAKTNRPTAIFDDDGVINYNATNSALEGKPKKVVVRKVTPYFLDKEADRILDQSYSAPEEDRKDMQDLANMMKRAASQAMVNMDAVPADFMKMPNIAKYGSLRGLVVHKLIYDDLVGTINTYGAAGEQTALENFFGNNGILAKITSAFKFSHVAINIPTQVTNLLSNGLLLHMSGVRFDKVPVRVTQAFKEVLNDGENYKKMIAMGGRKATFSNQELSGITEWLLENEAEFSDKDMDWFSVVHIMRELSYLAGKTVRSANNLHQNIEMVFKVAKFIDMKAKGANDETAAVMAHQALFDYSFIPRWAKWLRTVPMGIPFITWTIKSFEATLRTAANRPTTFLPYYMLGYAMSLAAGADFGDDGEDKLKAILKLLPERMQRGGSIWILPIRDDAGRTQLIDMKNLFPWGKTAEAIDSLSKLVGNQDVAELRNLADSVGVFSSPITQAVVAIDTNKDAFTGKQIVDENDPPAAKLQSILEYTYGMMSPPMLGGKGDIATLVKSQFPSQYEGIMNKDGSPKKTEQQAFIHLFTGLSIKSVDSEFDRHKKLEAFNNMITGIKAQRTRELHANPNLNEEARRNVREKYDARIERVKEKKQKFKDETDILK